jgi:hypothetical protein
MGSTSGSPIRHGVRSFALAVEFRQLAAFSDPATAVILAARGTLATNFENAADDAVT